MSQVAHPEPYRTPTVLVREIQAYGRTLFKPASDEARLLISLCSGRDNFNRFDLATIEALGFGVEVIPANWRTE